MRRCENQETAVQTIVIKIDVSSGTGRRSVMERQPECLVSTEWVCVCSGTER